MRAVDYALREGWRSFRRSGVSGVLATCAIGLALLVLGGTLLLTTNASRLAEQWTAAAEFSVFLDDTASSDERGAVEAEIDRSGIAAERTYLSKADALLRFRREFAELAALAGDLEENPFPASIEVRVRPGAEHDERTAELLARMASLGGVADVRYDRQWLDTLTDAVGTVRAVGWLMAILVGLAAAATVASVVRLGLLSRREEVEIMQLVGSPLAYIQGPFVAEGVLQGAVGALGALGLLWVGFTLVAGWVEGGLVLGGVEARFLPARLLVLLILGGMALGAVGGFAASRQARQASP